jgi:hypothetical protein
MSQCSFHQADFFKPDFFKADFVLKCFGTRLSRLRQRSRLLRLRAGVRMRWRTQMSGCLTRLVCRLALALINVAFAENFDSGFDRP